MKTRVQKLKLENRVGYKTSAKLLLLQVEAIKKISEFVAQLRRVGKGHGN